MKASQVHKLDEVVNSIALAIALTVIMTIITHWVIRDSGNSDLLISMAITFANAMVGALFIANHKMWAAQLSGFNHHERWSKEQVKLASIAACLILGSLGAAFFGLKFGTYIDKVFGTMFLFVTLPLARLARNAINSRGAADNRPTSAC